MSPVSICIHLVLPGEFSKREEEKNWLQICKQMIIYIVALIWHFLFHPSKWLLFYSILQIKTTSLQKNWKAQKEKQKCGKNHQVAYLKSDHHGHPAWLPSTLSLLMWIYACLLGSHWLFLWTASTISWIEDTLSLCLMERARAQGTGPGAEELALNSLARQVISSKSLHKRNDWWWGEANRSQRRLGGKECSCFPAGERAASRGSQV